MMYVRFILVKMLEALMWLLSLIIYPLAYLFRRGIYNNPQLWKWLLLYWFANSDEKNFTDNWYGDDRWRIENKIDIVNANWLQKFIFSYRWGALRNPHWNFKLLLSRHLDENRFHRWKVIDWIGEHPARIWRNRSITGLGFCTFYWRNQKHFRYSFTRQVKKWSPMRWLFGRRWINFMAGTGDGRYILKLRFWREL